MTYRYDVAGHLVYRREETGSTLVREDRFVYDGALLPQARVRYDDAGEVVGVERYVYATSGHVPDAVVRCGPEDCDTPLVQRVVTDHLGSVVGLVNASDGSFEEEARYDVWGELDGAGVAWEAAPFGFAGGLTDPATGWVLFGARWYDPAEGRWVSADPKGQAGGANLYAYGANAPHVTVDPTGLTPTCWGAMNLAQLRDFLFTLGPLDGAKSLVDLLNVYNPMPNGLAGGRGPNLEAASNLYVYTTSGWIDLRHLVFSAAVAFANPSAIGESGAFIGSNGGGLGVEILQTMMGNPSAFDPEDLRSNYHGYQLGRLMRDQGIGVDSPAFSQLMVDYLGSIGLTEPQFAPDWGELSLGPPGVDMGPFSDRFRDSDCGKCSAK